MDTAKLEMNNVKSIPKYINIIELKEFSKKHFRNYPILHAFIIEDLDFISPEDFILKCKIWLQLLGKRI